MGDLHTAARSQITTSPNMKYGQESTAAPQQTSLTTRSVNFHQNRFSHGGQSSAAAHRQADRQDRETNVLIGDRGGTGEGGHTSAGLKDAYGIPVWAS